MNGNKRMELLGSAPIPRALLTLGMPTMVGMMINALYNLVDAYFVGGLGETQMGAISVVFPLGQAVVGLGLLFGNGAASYLSRLLGGGDRETADRVAGTALYSGLFLGGAAVLLAAGFLRPLLTLLSATETIMPYAVTYGRIYVLSSVFNVFNVTMNNIVTGEGAAKTTMCALLLGAALNIMLDPVFIYALDLGIAGAAIATGISQAVSALVYLAYILRGKSIFTFHIRTFAPTKTIMSEILKIGIPTLVFQLLTSGSITLINAAAKDYGDGVIAVMGNVTRITAMGTLAVFGFLKGFQPIAGFSYGAGLYQRLRQTIKTAVLWSTAFCAVVGLLTAVFSVPIITHFSKAGGEIAAIGGRALTASGLSFCLFGFYTVYSFLLLAMGKSLSGFLLGACRQGLCFIPLILLLPAGWGLDGVLYAQPLADVLSALIAGYAAVRVHGELS